MLLDWKSFLPKVGGSMKELSEISPETITGYKALHAEWQKLRTPFGELEP